MHRKDTHQSDNVKKVQLCIACDTLVAGSDNVLHFHTAISRATIIHVLRHYPARAASYSSRPLHLIPRGQTAQIAGSTDKRRVNGNDYNYYVDRTLGSCESKIVHRRKTRSRIIAIQTWTQSPLGFIHVCCRPTTDPQQINANGVWTIQRTDRHTKKAVYRTTVCTSCQSLLYGETTKHKVLRFSHAILFFSFLSCMEAPLAPDCVQKQVAIRLKIYRKYNTISTDSITC